MDRAWLRATDVTVGEGYERMIAKLREDKIAINKSKIKKNGYWDLDDHGSIPHPDFTFEPELCEDGKVHGTYMIGKNFKRFMEQMPRYINRDSALAGAWIGFFGNYVPMAIPESARPKAAFEVFQKYHIHQHGFGAMNHLCPDLKIGLELGWQGLLDKVRACRARNNPVDTSFYDGEELLLEGIITWVGHLADEAEKRAQAETDGFYRENYLEMARVNRKLTTQAPSTFREAVQFLAHFQSVDRMYCSGGGSSPIDDDLRDYYVADVEAGRLTDEQAVWMIASLLYNDTHYTMLGGLTPDGSRDKVDHFSFVVLEATHQLRIPSNVAMRVHPKLNDGDLSDALLEKSLVYNLKDGTGICYSLERGITEGYAHNGYPEPLGRMRTKSGCNWCAIPGREYPLQDVTRLSMPMAMQFAMDELAEGLRKRGEEPTLDKLWERYCAHMSTMVAAIKEGYDAHYEVMHEYIPEIVLNLFMHGPIERGINCSSGGVDINNFNIDGIGLATVADSFAAIEQRVVKEGRISWAQLFDMLDSNFEGAERERLMLKNIARFGNPDSLAEGWMIKLRDFYVHECKKSTTPKHHLMIIPGLFSHGDVVTYGHQLKASANGRRAGEPISHSSEPDPGFAAGLSSFSFVLKANAVAESQAGYGNSAPLQLDIDTSLLSKAGGVAALKALIHAHEQAGGTLINLNCLSKEKLMEAHEDPDRYPELVVRVTGYSAFFASLSREYRQQVIDRFLA